MSQGRRASTGGTQIVSLPTAKGRACKSQEKSSLKEVTKERSHARRRGHSVGHTEEAPSACVAHDFISIRI